MKDALDTSEKIKGAGSRVWGAVSLLFPASVTAVIAPNSWFTARERVLYPAAAFSAWVGVLMLEVAFKKHEAQEERIKSLEYAKSIKLEIVRVTYQKDGRGDYQCRVMVLNSSTSDVVSNVHVRVSGQVIPNLYNEGYSPFNEPDLSPASGSRSINPGTQSDWLFPSSFNSLVGYLTGRINVVRVNYPESSEAKTKQPDQTFSVEVSAASSPAAIAEFEITRDEKGGLGFKRLPDNPKKTNTPATI